MMTPNNLIIFLSIGNLEVTSQIIYFYINSLLILILVQKMDDSQSTSSRHRDRVISILKFIINLAIELCFSIIMANMNITGIKGIDIKTGQEAGALATERAVPHQNGLLEFTYNMLISLWNDDV
jgi:hypothetical protein